MLIDGLIALGAGLAALASIAVLPASESRGRQRDAATSWRQWLAGLLLLTSIALWVFVSGWRIGIVHWLISLSIAGPFVVLGRAESPAASGAQR